MNQLSRTKSLALIVFLVVVWGVSWPIYKMALQYTPPLLFAALRTFVGGLLLAILYLKNRSQIAWKQTWPIYLISSIFNVTLFYGLQTIGLMYVPSGLFSVIVYLQPVLVGIMAWMWLGESMAITKIIGLIIGVLGVAAVSAGGLSGHVAVIGIMLAVVTAVSWAIGTVYVKKVSGRVNSIWLVAFQCMIGGLVLAGAGTATESWSDIVWHNTYFLTGLIFGIILGISASWVVYFTLVNAGDASKVAAYTFLVPLISVLTGTLFLDEPFTIYLVFGLVLIGVSIYLVNRKPKALTEPGKIPLMTNKPRRS